MAWSQLPTRRKDLLVEDQFTLDGSGGFTGDWLETGDVFRVRLAAFFLNAGSGSLVIEEGQYDSPSATPRVLRSQSVTVSSSRGFGEFDLTTRFFRIKITGGSPTDFCCVTVRGVL